VRVDGRHVARVVGLAALVGYDLVLRPWMRQWGSTPEEQAIRLPGDEVPSDVMTHYTKGITIDAPPEAVWPWLVQIGDRRAGFYSHDWVERFVFLGTVHYAEGSHSARQIHPELQDVHVGDVVNLASVGRLLVGNPVTLVEPNRVFVMGTWTFNLRPIPGGRTRLLVRDRDDGYLRHLAPPRSFLLRTGLAVVDFLVGDPLHFVMERQMMLGLKARSEGSREDAQADVASAVHPHAR
jgi:hypothetical protein